MPHRLELHFQKSKRTGITNRYHPLHKSNEKRLTEVCSVSLMSIAEKTGDYVGLRSPPPRILFFYEKSIQKRIKEEVSSLISPQGGSLPHSNRKRSRSPLSITKVRCIAGGIEGGTPPSAGNPKTRRFLVYLCLLSLHKKVSPGCRGGEPPCKRNRFAETSL